MSPLEPKENQHEKIWIDLVVGNAKHQLFWPISYLITL